MKCSVCGVFVKDGNLGNHFDKAHPGDTRPIVPKMPRPKRMRQPLSGGAKSILVMGLVVLILSIAAGYFISSMTTPDDTDCVGHSVMAYHWHAELLVYEDVNPITIPANVGIEPGCMGPIHTHDNTNRIHMEPSDADVRFTVGDFFGVWGKPFGNPQSMSVDGESVDPSSDIVLLDGMVVEVFYP